ncbi:DUF4232 domain-containing protein [Amycolatopsis ultiminotia]|uniref:DUF4232 domain-containing protein n=1 Tax=Amycolatopsis ultiminotia TaxID=543629 RepID=A0ABP6VQ39_9PSEU
MSPNQLKRVSLGAAVVAGAFTLAACGSTSGAAAPSTSEAATASSSVSSPATDAPTDDPTDASDADPGSGSTPSATKPAKDTTPRCTTDDLSAALGKPKQSPGGGVDQIDLPLSFKNTSSHNCALYGVPGVDLNGPDDPTYGNVYHLPRQDNGVRHNVVEPGRTATATITTLKASAGSPGWTPTGVTTIPPGQTKALHASWPSDIAIVRQDGATHPGTRINGILADPA